MTRSRTTEPWSQVFGDQTILSYQTRHHISIVHTEIAYRILCILIKPQIFDKFKGYEVTVKLVCS